MTRWDRSMVYATMLRDGALRASVRVYGTGKCWWWTTWVEVVPNASTVREASSMAPCASSRAAKRAALTAARECLAHVVRARGGA